MLGNERERECRREVKGVKKKDKRWSSNTERCVLKNRFMNNLSSEHFFFLWHKGFGKIQKCLESSQWSD